MRGPLLISWALAPLLGCGAWVAPPDSAAINQEAINQAVAAAMQQQRFEQKAAAPVSVAPTWPDLMQPADGVKDGAKDAALIVAIENYDYIEGVAGARANAVAWETWLRNTKGVPHIKMLIDRDAKHAWAPVGRGKFEAMGVISELKQMVSLVKPGGKLWFIFIGHGGPGEGGKDGLLLGADVEQTPESFKVKGIPVQGMLIPTLSKAPQVVAVLDACFSGLNSEGQKLVEGLQPALHVVMKAPSRKITILSAAKSDQFAGRLPGVARPAFSYLALGALRGWGDSDRDGVITADEVQSYTRATLLTMVTGRKQEPDLAGDGALALARGAREAKPVLGSQIQLGVQPTQPSVSPVVQPIVPPIVQPSAQPALPSGADFGALARQAAAEDAARRAREAQSARQAKADADAKAARAKRFDAALSQDWAQAQPLLRRGDALGQQALSAFLAKWGDPQRGDLEFPNRFADEARATLAAGRREAEAQARREAEARATVAQARGKGGVEWISIKGGSFQMGSNKGSNDEKPVHTVRVRDFWIGKTEVTVKQYRACVTAGACSKPDTGEYCNWGQSGREDHPINCVDWNQAQAFATWAGGRLPSEAEWEYAARSQGQGREYPWGNAQATCDYAVM
ncbi:SUMF1/EgtB/PvdO family nonheme iron enzyme, partial [Myxococcota bacterium]|nr:SUMF1/EgtB/PvdO family nonheme iron enzyme [Myxococcota bacterium]